MRNIYLFCLLFLVSCSFTKNTYICGDHTCLDKKEFNEYFAENLIVEIKSNKFKKKTSIDLVKLNSPTQKNDAEINGKNVQYETINKNEQKKKLKAKKIQLRAERKIKKIEDKKRSQNEKALIKLNKKKKKLDMINGNTSNIGKPSNESLKKKKVLNIKKKPKDSEVLQNIKSVKQANLCEQIQDCDIDKITELLIKKGKQKEFPDINSN